MATIRSVNVGEPVLTDHSSTRTTGIDKRPTDRIEVRAPGPRRGGLGSGVVGDTVSDSRHHGGDHQAVYAVAREELDWWGAELGRHLRDGMFGENLTTMGLDVDGAIIGERWVIGGGGPEGQEGAVVLEVTAPRIPCRTFARHLAEPRWVKRFTARGRTGAYLRVVTPGSLEPGLPVRVVDRPAHGISVPEVFAAMTGDRQQAERVVEAGILGAPHHAQLAAKLARTRPSGSSPG